MEDQRQSAILSGNGESARALATSTFLTRRKLRRRDAEFFDAD